MMEVAPIETRVGAPGVDEWRALNERARAGTMFLGPEWLLPWWTQFGEGRELATLCVRESGRLIGLLPLFIERVRLGGIGVRRLAFLGDGDTGCDYLDVLADPGREREVLEHCLAKLMELPWDVCDLDGLLRDGFTPMQLAQRLPPGGATNSVGRGGRSLPSTVSRIAGSSTTTSPVTSRAGLASRSGWCCSRARCRTRSRKGSTSSTSSAGMKATRRNGRALSAGPSRCASGAVHAAAPPGPRWAARYSRERQ